MSKAQTRIVRTQPIAYGAHFESIEVGQSNFSSIPFNGREYRQYSEIPSTVLLESYTSKLTERYTFHGVLYS